MRCFLFSWVFFPSFSLGLDFENVKTEKLHLYHLAHSGLDILLEILDIIFLIWRVCFFSLLHSYL